METVSCICCWSHEYIALLTNKKDEYKKLIKNLTRAEKATRYVVCRDCGFVYQNPRLEVEKLAEMYKKVFRTMPPEKHRPPDVQMQAEWILQEVDDKTDGRDVLDVGCDVGTSLNIFKKRGWDTFGVEPTVSYAEYGIREYGHKIEIGMYDDKMFEGKKFDLIILSHVIEHVYDPLALLISIRKKLKEGGYIYIGTPNVSRYSVKQKVGFWDMFSCGHLYLFSLVSISNILHKAGLNVVASRTMGSRDAIDIIAQDAQSKKIEFLTEKPDQIKKIINSFRFKVPFLKAKRAIRDFYKSIYKGCIRKPLKRIFSFILGKQISERFFS